MSNPDLYSNVQAVIRAIEDHAEAAKKAAGTTGPVAVNSALAVKYLSEGLEALFKSAHEASKIYNGGQTLWPKAPT